MNYKKILFIGGVTILLAAFPVTVILFLITHGYLYICNPYSRFGIFKSPYGTSIGKDGAINYYQNYRPKVYSGLWADWLGYYRSGLLIVANTIFGGNPIKKKSRQQIIAEIHRQRFDPTKPYLISGDQFSVLYPRNLGVFYNKLIDKDSSLSKKDFQNRQRIYLQSVLLAIDGLAAGSSPKTTLVPIGPRHIALTQVHPGGVGSDQVYGLLYALDQLKNQPQTNRATLQLISEKMNQLKHIVHVYLASVRDPETGMIRTGMHLASARDGVVRSSSMYDNIVLWKTLHLSYQLGILKKDEATSLRKIIKKTFWNQAAGFYNDDIQTHAFSSDVLLGYVTNFFDLNSNTDLTRTERMITYIEASELAKPFPIKYQASGLQPAPFFVRLLVPTYGSSAIWSYWGSEYITLLVAVYKKTNKQYYLKLAKKHMKAYDSVIVRDGGFAETFDSNGNFMQRGVYKSIRVTGWIVQYEYARHALLNIKNDTPR